MNHNVRSGSVRCPVSGSGELIRITDEYVWYFSCMCISNRESGARRGDAPRRTRAARVPSTARPRARPGGAPLRSPARGVRRESEILVFYHFIAYSFSLSSGFIFWYFKRMPSRIMNRRAITPHGIVHYTINKQALLSRPPASAHRIRCVAAASSPQEVMRARESHPACI